MKKELFVSELKKLQPAEEKFALLGYSRELIEKKVNRYYCIKRTTPLTFSSHNSELINLLNYYDCSNVEIGIVSLNNSIEEIANYSLLGNVEADILALNKVTLEIVTLDHLDLDWPIWQCAGNGEKFLDALLSSAEYFSRCINNTELAYNTSFTYEYVLLCTEKAGGEKYMDFYKVLLGYDE